MSGVVPLRIIPLIEVGFYKAQAPSILVRRALCQGESLEQVDDGGLLSLFKISELHVPPGQENPPPEARDRKDRRRRRP